jgi:hypothetical protein
MDGNEPATRRDIAVHIDACTRSTPAEILTCSLRSPDQVSLGGGGRDTDQF